MRTDLLFLEGKTALFKVALCLLSCHKQKILEQDGFETIVYYLKSELPRIDDDAIDEVLCKVCARNKIKILPRVPGIPLTAPV